VQIGTAVALGVLIDTFVVRALLVPSLTHLLGDRAWWPFGVTATREREAEH
jgi:RND superfamily putative drug exporter